MRMYQLLNSIRENLDIVRKADLNDLIGYYAALHALQIACQSLIDMMSLASSAIGKPPASFSAAGEILAEEGVLDSEELDKYRGIVGFRNVIVHNYLDVDRDLVKYIVKTGEFEEIEFLALKVLKFTESKGIDP